MVNTPCHVRVISPSAENVAKPSATIRDNFGWMPVDFTTAATYGDPASASSAAAAPSPADDASSDGDGPGCADGERSIYASANARLAAEVTALREA